MGKPIPSADEVAKKWATRAGAATTDYVSGAKSATWKAEAAAGEANYAKAIQEAISKKSRLAGINKVSDADWQAAVESKSSRYGDGVSKGTAKMSAGMTPVLNDIKSNIASLPARGPRGDPGNYQRSQKLGQALHDSATKRKSA